MVIVSLIVLMFLTILGTVLGLKAIYMKNIFFKTRFKGFNVFINFGLDLFLFSSIVGIPLNLFAVGESLIKNLGVDYILEFVKATYMYSMLISLPLIFTMYVILFYHLFYFMKTVKTPTIFFKDNKKLFITYYNAVYKPKNDAKINSIDNLVQSINKTKTINYTANNALMDMFYYYIRYERLDVSHKKALGMFVWR